MLRYAALDSQGGQAVQVSCAGVFLTPLVVRSLTGLNCCRAVLQGRQQAFWL